MEWKNVYVCIYNWVDGFKRGIINHDVLRDDDNNGNGERYPIFKALQNVYHRLCDNLLFFFLLFIFPLSSFLMYNEENCYSLR